MNLDFRDCFRRFQWDSTKLRNLSLGKIIFFICEARVCCVFICVLSSSSESNSMALVWCCVLFLIDYFELKKIFLDFPWSCLWKRLLKKYFGGFLRLQWNFVLLNETYTRRQKKGRLSNTSKNVVCVVDFGVRRCRLLSHS